MECCQYSCNTQQYWSLFSSNKAIGHIECCLSLVMGCLKNKTLWKYISTRWKYLKMVLGSDIHVVWNLKDSSHCKNPYLFIRFISCLSSITSIPSIFFSTKDLWTRLAIKKVTGQSFLVMADWNLVYPALDNALTTKVFWLSPWTYP